MTQQYNNADVSNRRPPSKVGRGFAVFAVILALGVYGSVHDSGKSHEEKVAECLKDYRPVAECQ